MVNRIRGATPEDRAVARLARRARRREADYHQRVQTAQTPRRKLIAVCDYARATADDMSGDYALMLAQRIADVTRDTWEESQR